MVLDLILPPPAAAPSVEETPADLRANRIQPSRAAAREQARELH